MNETMPNLVEIWSESNWRVNRLPYSILAVRTSIAEIGLFSLISVRTFASSRSSSASSSKTYAVATAHSKGSLRAAGWVARRVPLPTSGMQLRARCGVMYLYRVLGSETDRRRFSPFAVLPIAGRASIDLKGPGVIRPPLVPTHGVLAVSPMWGALRTPARPSPSP